MRPPKRSPFLGSRHAELLEVYRHLYPDSPLLASNASSAVHRHTALSLVQLWINRSACPFAVETTALLVQSLILDEHMQQIALASRGDKRATSSLHYALEQMGGGAELGVRLNYSLALTRFVNSVVDSHQTGGFAQSIAAIAARIGLPLWFVEIRHAVTHEELPSIGVCRHAARAALAWLHSHFWVPQLFDADAEPSQASADRRQAQPASGQGSSSRETASSTFGVATATPSSEQEETRRAERRKALHELREMLARYRELAKQVARDRSLANAAKAEFRRLYKQLAVFVARIRTLEPDFGAQLIERAGGKAKDEEVDARTQALDPDDVDECTKAALADLVNQLLRPGGLIPLSRAKRASAAAGGEALVLPGEVAAIWTPLLAYLRETFGRIVGQILAEELVDVALRPPRARDDETAAADDADEDDDPSSHAWRVEARVSPSYRRTAEAWLRYLMAGVPGEGGTTIAALVSDVEVAELCLPLQLPGSAALLEWIAERNRELGARIAPLVSVLRVSAFVAAAELEGAHADTGGLDFADQLDVMQSRLDQMDAVAWTQPQQTQDSAADGEHARARKGSRVNGSAVSEEANMPVGWSAAPAHWKPTPFGCLEGRIPPLVLDL